MTARAAAIGTMTAILAISGTVYFAYLLKQDMGEDLTKQLDIKQKLNAPVELNANLVNEDGKTVPFKSLFKGRPVVLMPIFYTCKSACAVELEASLKAFRDMKTDFIGETYDVATISIHPKETSELAKSKKADFLERYMAGRDASKKEKAEANWHFMTGQQSEVEKITNSVGFRYTYNAEKDRVVHPTAVMLLTPEGRVSQYIIGKNFPQPYTRNAILAAGQNVIGAPAQAVTYFGCFTYDPTTGKTMLHVKGAIQILGAITLIAMVASIISMNRRFKEEHGNKEVSSDA